MKSRRESFASYLVRAIPIDLRSSLDRRAKFNLKRLQATTSELGANPFQALLSERAKELPVTEKCDRCI